MLKSLFENPVMLRDMGWKYYPPLLGRFSRPLAQFLAAILIMATIIGIAIWAERRLGEDAGWLILALFAGGGYAAFMLRAPISGLRAWTRERELHVLEELVLTGMKPSEFAAAKVFARGFPFVAGSLMIIFLAYGSIGWYLILADPESEMKTLLTVLAADIIALPSLMIIIYLRMLRIGLRAGFQLHRAIISYIAWVIFGFIMALVMPAIYLYLGHLLDISNPLTIVVPFAFLCIPGFWALIRLSHIHLLSDIERYYIQNIDA